MYDMEIKPALKISEYKSHVIDYWGAFERAKSAAGSRWNNLVWSQKVTLISYAYYHAGNISEFDVKDLLTGEESIVLECYDNELSTIGYEEAARTGLVEIIEHTIGGNAEDYLNLEKLGEDVVNEGNGAFFRFFLHDNGAELSFRGYIRFNV